MTFCVSFVDLVVVVVRGIQTDQKVHGSVHEFYSLKDSQINKVHTSSHEITIKPYKSSNYENIDKTTITDSLNTEL